jgi:hypothetical protein
MADPTPRESTGKRVLVAIEEHECSHYALEWTLLNLKPSLTSPLLLITVQPLSAFTYLTAASYSAPRMILFPLSLILFYSTIRHFDLD